MKIYKYPKESEWAELLRRPTKDATVLNDTVAFVLREVRERGDSAVKEFEEKFDKVSLQSLAVTEEEMNEAETLVSTELKKALELAHRNIHTFHASHKFEGKKCQVTDGVTCWQKSVPIERVGLYIPGGTLHSGWYCSLV